MPTAIMFASCKNKELLRFGLESNNIRTGDDTEVSDFLATNPPLKVLHLGNNHLNDNDAVLFARALKRNTNLRYLHIGSDIADVGRDALST